MQITMDGKYQTRDGRAVEILRTNVKNRHFPVVGIITERDGSETQDRWTAEGWYLTPIDGSLEDSDLIPVTTKHGGWVPLLTAGNSDVPRIDGVVNAGKAEIENFCERYHAYTLAHVTWED